MSTEIEAGQVAEEPRGRARRMLDAALGFFERVSLPVVAPRAAVADAVAGRWGAAHDAANLFLLIIVTVYLRDVVVGAVVGWDLGIQQGLVSIYWNLERVLGFDMLVLLGACVLVLVPMRLSGRLSFERSLHLTAVAWIPVELVRSVGQGLRVLQGLPPARFPVEPDWYLGLGWLALIVVLGYAEVFSGPNKTPKA